ncbi:hypothetical protein ABIB06_004708 [Bradyrhizobium sp. LB8.2]|uniref:DUF262 domain-containing protein n=1 Tax=unclassified Bradyrhizobium TaxID=2631580 RepID=UPI003398A988
MTQQLSLIEAHESRLNQIFSDDYEFEIPSYQRPYAWEEQQAQELLTDFIEAMDNGDDVYFLGSIVLIKEPHKPLSRVVDGQQRLTTLTIILSILRDLTTDQEVRGTRRVYVYQKANPDSGAAERFRLLLRQRDRAFFQKYIQNPDATNSLPDPDLLEGSQQNIARNAIHLRSELSKLDEDRRNKLIAYLIQRCYLVVVAVPTPEAARRIFTVLNARGLDLTATDILKANLLERAGSNEKDLAERWETAELALGRDRMVELFGHIRTMFERDKPRIALEVGFPKFVQTFNENAERFVSDTLEPIADAMLLVGESPGVKKQFGDEAAKAVRSLERIDNKDWMPPVLLRLWKRKKDDQTSVAAFLVEIERLAYYLFVTRADINTRIARYSGVMDEFDPRSGKEKPKAGIALTAAEQQEFLDALSGPLYQKARVCKPVLQRLDEALSSGGASYDELVSIEHVLPQTVSDSSEWATLFPEEAQRAEWTHRLANLVFLTRRINTRASNWDFGRKKKEYFVSKDGASPFPLTQGVLQAGSWTPEHLVQRQATLIGRLASVWSLAQLPTDGSTQQAKEGKLTTTA